jgi:hypothetical protein
VQARYDRLLADIRDEASPTLPLRKMAAQFIKVTASHGAQIFACYDVPGLPRTDNDLEQRFGGVRHPLRRATGQKNAPASLVVRGSASAAFRASSGGASGKIPRPTCKSSRNSWSS